MSGKNFLVVGLCGLLLACSTGGYHGQSMAGDSTTRKGVRYLLGRGVPQDDGKAFYYFNQAANENDPFAQNEVAYLYAAGKGTAQDYRKALEWYEKAANHGLASAQYSLAMLYLKGLGTARNHTLGMKWLHQSADHGFEPAVLALKHASNL